ncbi:unnamed protein product [Schistosoma margrebowiei]|uniref:Uncharacterized protein n=1 Tax=Schistosoma margrebowiei TaxID=48269 RepID=A0A183MG12_9TREM|nr:unnamed protein product [Schistosoma margrebowiei]
MSSNRITLDGEALKEVETITYLDTIIDKQGGSDANVMVRIDKSRTTFLHLKNIYNSKKLSTKSESSIRTPRVLLYGAETWRTTTSIIEILQVFINNYLQKVLNICCWPNIISNNTL